MSRTAQNKRELDISKEEMGTLKFSIATTALIWTILALVFTPELSLQSDGVHWLLMIAGAIWSAPYLISLDSGSYQRDIARVFGRIGGGLFATGLLLSLFFWVAGMGWAIESQAKGYANLIGEVQEKSADALPALDIERVADVPAEIALNRALKKLSEQEVASIGSQYTVDTMYKQVVNGELRWVGMLEPRGFMRWLLEDGAPGYVSVSAFDENDAVLVTELKGKKLVIRKGEGHFMHDEVNRAMWLASNGMEYLTNAVLEIDDEGNPFWVSAIGERAVSNDGIKVAGVLVMDAQTGIATQYGLKEVPAWIDQVYPVRLVSRNLELYGRFVKGAWNFANEGKISFENIDMVYDPKGGAQIIASAAAFNNNSTGLFAFMSVDTRTGAATYFPFTAVEESEATRAILGTLPKGQLDFTVDNPRPYLVNGVPTYVAIAYTGVGANKHYAFSAIDNPQRVAVRTSLQAAYQAYLALPSGSSELAVNQAMTEEKVQSVVQRIAPVGKGYQVLFKGDNTIYTADAEVILELGLTQAGDRVKARVNKGNALQGAILEMDNLEFGAPAVQEVKTSEPAVSEAQ